jgi:hypothetical protein
MYGVDQCRVCGKPITVRSPRTRAEQEEAIRNPFVPEKVWRARGYLTVPTERQWRSDVASGCCGVCGRNELRRRLKMGKRGAALAVGAVLTILFLGTIILFLPH